MHREGSASKVGGWKNEVKQGYSNNGQGLDGLQIKLKRQPQDVAFARDLTQPTNQPNIVR